MARRSAADGSGEPDSSPPAAPAVADPTWAAAAAQEPQEPQATPETMIERAEDLLAEGKVAQACALGEAAAARGPRLPSARGFLGRCYTRTGQLDKARDNYRTYLELVPTAPDAPFVRAIIERKTR